MRCTKIRCPIQHGQVKEPCTQTDCPYRTEPATNADRIRSMSDEELAKIITCPYDNALESCIPGSNCLDCCLKWLKQPCESPTGQKG